MIIYFYVTLLIYLVFRKTVRDKQTGQDVVLSDKDVEIIHRLEASKIPDSAFNEYAVNNFSSL